MADTQSGSKEVVDWGWSLGVFSENPPSVDHNAAPTAILLSCVMKTCDLSLWSLGTQESVPDSPAELLTPRSPRGGRLATSGDSPR